MGRGDSLVTILRMIVVVPWRFETAREPLFEWVLARWREHGVEPRVGQIGGDWCKARAVAAALDGSEQGPLVITDADVWTDGVLDAVANLRGWAVPHRMVHRLDRLGTLQVLAGAHPGTVTGAAQRPYEGFAGGGVVVVDADVYRDVPLDSRFVGWGQEDESWAHALTTLVGAPWRGEEPLWHLWHPPAKRRSRSIGNRRGSELCWEYRRADGHPDRMRLLVDEGKL